MDKLVDTFFDKRAKEIQNRIIEYSLFFGVIYLGGHILVYILKGVL